MPNDPRHSRFVAVKGHTGTLVIDTHAGQPETMTFTKTTHRNKPAIKVEDGSIAARRKVTEKVEEHFSDFEWPYGRGPNTVLAFQSENERDDAFEFLSDKNIHT